MIINMQQITFMYGVDVARDMMQRAWPKYQFKDHVYLDGASTLCGFCSWRDFHGMDANHNRRREFIAENT